jgi:hypothetical protein
MLSWEGGLAPASDSQADSVFLKYKTTLGKSGGKRTFPTQNLKDEEI